MKSFLDTAVLDAEANPDLYQEISSSIVVKQVEKNTILQHKGAQSRSAFFVRKGLLRSYSIDEKGRVHIFMFAPEGWIVSDIESLAKEAPAELFIDTIEDSEIEILQFPLLIKLEALMPSAVNIQSLLKRIAVLQRRVIMLMSASARERYEEFVQTYPSIVNRVPQHMIASYLGVTPEALSKIKREVLRSTQSD